MEEREEMDRITTEIGARQMARQTRYRDYVVPDGVTRIGKEAFMDSTRLRRVYLPKSVAVIERDAFKGCENVEIYCEDAPQEGWVCGLRKEIVQYETVTPEDDAFNFHRSAGSFTTTIIEREVESFHNWNSSGRPVHTHVPREETEDWLTPEEEERLVREERERAQREQEERDRQRALHDRKMRIFHGADLASEFARRAVKELLRENKAFKKVDFEWVAHGYADHYEANCAYTNLPSAFCGWEKLYEAPAEARLSEIKEGLEQAFRRALEAQGKAPRE